ncbi:type II toxin-antitoxin system prevent-host-death family antitoxin [Neisseria perflava]|uniref:type II toxin-antitoxin system prevent-host-death family antitoxin n=1 Tax=Neisseria perflava TaxID=33053 RepID=UPI0020A0CF1A|nr:type II toxin-antitoxin system prevent-host-death family antitoxin [Neisseria perflava]MCP1661242.1 prevent-host-death family protein [Neisseria perflava]MCP1773273.1 prevent-host-death family protein [Neisseria perflava]
MQTMTSREFNQRTNEAQKAARRAPLLITQRGEPDLVVMSYQEYQKIADKPKTLLEVFQQADPELLAAVADIELEIPLRSTAQRRPVEFD